MAAEDKKKARGAKVTIGGHQLSLTNLDKVLFPPADSHEHGITKGEVIDYYQRIAEIALPLYRDRPLSQQRFPDGIDQEGFFQKDMPDYFPDWIARSELPKEDGTVTYVLANDAATLAYLANQGCITPHLALARCDRPQEPDRLIFDLDPSDDDFAKVRRAAFWTRDRLEELQLPSFVMTTGSRGLHVVVPLDRSCGFDTVRDFAHQVAVGLAEAHPDELTVAQRKDKRGSRVFLDYLRNGYGQTSVAPYALRAKAGAPVATPITWQEAGDRKLGPRRYTLANIFRRLAQTADPWADIDHNAVSLNGAFRRLAAEG